MSGRVVGGSTRLGTRAEAPSPVLALFVLVLILTAVKAGTADITWDESWTFLHYGRTASGFLRLDYANDHVLNSIAVFGSTQLFGPSVLAIRLPNVLCGILYLGATARMVGAVRPETVAVALALAVLNPYLLEHFALARGYGIAAALLQAGLVLDCFARSGPDRAATDAVPARSLLLAAAASYAVVSDVAIVLALGAARLASAGRDRTAFRSAASAFAIAAVLAAPAFAIGLHETRPGVPVFGSDGGPFDAFACGVARMWVTARAATPVAVAATVACALALVAVRRHASPRTRLLLLATGVEIGLLVGGSWLFGRRMPTDRLLVPSLPLWNALAVSVVEDLGAARPARMQAIGLVLLGLCGSSFVLRTDPAGFIDWAPDRTIARATAELERSGARCFPPNVFRRYGHEYYLFRWFGAPGAGIVPDRACGSGDHGGAGPASGAWVRGWRGTTLPISLSWRKETVP